MTPDEIEKDRAPERIWIDAERTYSATFFSAGIPYVRADLFDALTAERDAALALVAAAYEVAASEVAPLLSSALVSKASAHTESFANAMGERADGLELSIRRIRALTPADALAAQAARDERMRKEGEREALLNLTDKVQVIRREASGKANGARFQALDDVRQMIAKEIDALQENRNGQLNLF